MEVSASFSFLIYLLQIFYSAEFGSAKFFSASNHLQPSMAETTKRYAVVTGSNRGIGLEICRQLAIAGITVVLTARDDKKGLEAAEKLKKDNGFSDQILVFHQLDVSDPASISSLANFLKTQFGKVDILVNNAAIGGVIINSETLRKETELAGDWPTADKAKWDEMAPQTYELAEECVKTNYYGTKKVTEALFPLLQLSDSARLVNVSSYLGLLMHIPSEEIKAKLNNIENLTEDKIDEILNEFLQDFKQDHLESKGWPTFLSGYTMAKAAMNAYTRILAKKHPTIMVNSVHPGYVKTGITGNNGMANAADAAESLVEIALLPENGPSGVFFSQKQALGFF